MVLKHQIDTIYVFTPARMEALAMGGLLAATLPRLLRFGAPSLMRKATTAAIVLGVVNLMILWRSPERISPLSLTVGYSLISVFFAATLIMALVAPATALTGKFLNSAMLRSLGKYSYGLYVYHVILTASFERSFGQRWMNDVFSARLHLGRAAYGVSVIAFIILASCASFVIAWLSWHLFEKQFLKLKKYFA